MKVKAIYRKKGLNPFARKLPRDSFLSITAEIPEGTKRNEIIKLARKAIPSGYEFAKIEKPRRRKTECSR